MGEFRRRERAVVNPISYADVKSNPGGDNTGAGIQTREVCCILGVDVHSTTLAQALSAIEDYVASGRPHQVVTVNMDFLRIAQKDESFRAALNGADLAVPDGMPLLWISRWTRQRLVQRVAGVDLVEQLAALAAERGYSMYFLGAESGVADAAAAVLRSRHPGLRIVGTYAPPFGPFSAEEDTRIVARVRSCRPDILCAAFGAPKQDVWIASHLEELEVPVCIGVGGTLDFIAGRVPRAPGWMQKRGLEWAYRLRQEPRRLWRRYLLGDLPLLLRVAYLSSFPALGSARR
jgi:N-acetylglucosaminyldiphosphoundecaprenol N-acetyl-beta-D-mannosaminyltransferase